VVRSSGASTAHGRDAAPLTMPQRSRLWRRAHPLPWRRLHPARDASRLGESLERATRVFCLVLQLKPPRRNGRGCILSFAPHCLRRSGPRGSTRRVLGETTSPRLLIEGRTTGTEHDVATSSSVLRRDEASLDPRAISVSEYKTACERGRTHVYNAMQHGYGPGTSTLCEGTCLAPAATDQDARG
jgi:hypothetical protein